MYKELKKYETGKKIDGIGILPDGQEIKIKLDEYEASLGELISDFIEHKRMSWWKRKYNYEHLTKLYLTMLNKIQIKHGF